MDIWLFHKAEDEQKKSHNTLSLSKWYREEKLMWKPAISFFRKISWNFCLINKVCHRLLSVIKALGESKQKICIREWSIGKWFLNHFQVLTLCLCIFMSLFCKLQCMWWCGENRGHSTQRELKKSLTKESMKNQITRVLSQCHLHMTLGKLFYLWEPQKSQFVKWFSLNNSEVCGKSKCHNTYKRLYIL